MRNPFRRKSKNQTIAELESYYATQGTKRRTGSAWFMAILSLLITVLVIVALYFGVRWIYRTVTDDSGDETVATGTVDSDGGATVIGGDSSSDPRSSEDVIAGVLNPSDDDEDSETEEEGVVSDEAASTTRDPSEVAGDSDSLATTGGSEELPSTGAGETVLLALIAVTAFGYYASRRSQLSK